VDRFSHFNFEVPPEDANEDLGFSGCRSQSNGEIFVPKV
jgi:hypothetical protein